jgi:anti-sigma B factor antagonist
MNEKKKEVKIIQIPHQRLVYELLEDTKKEWFGYLDQGYTKFVIDMSKVSFMDSASIGCLMDFYRKTKSADGRIHLAAVQPRIETLLAIAKAKSLFGIYENVDLARKELDQ